MKKLYSQLLSLVLALTGSSLAWAAGGGNVPLDKFPAERVTEVAALQNGAKLFANYCLNCHAAAFMRYTRLRDLELNDTQIKENLMFGSDRMADTMTVALTAKQGKEWFGAVPPDLTLIARAKGPDYLYTYLRTFYRDPERPTGWNNRVFPNVGMPHVLWELQGQRIAETKPVVDAHHPEKTTLKFDKYAQISAGQLSPGEYDAAVADLVAYLAWMGEPGQNARVRIGVGVLIFLFIFTLIAWRLNAAYWKDIK